MNVYRFAKRAYKSAVPLSWNGAFFSGHTSFSRFMLQFKTRLERYAEHDDLYDSFYYERQHQRLAGPGREIAKWLADNFAPESAIDIGCGSGGVIAGFRDLKVPAVGLEYSQAAIEMCLAQGLRVHKFDLERDSVVEVEPAALVVSTEVAEHLPEHCASRYVDLCCQLSTSVVVLTAALPGQGGTDHVNEQPNEYWIQKFEDRGWRFDLEKTEACRREWEAAGVDILRSRNVMIFRS
jgi:SAM-dependent methyltransferase